MSGALKLLSTQTASNSASVEFTSGIDSTYDEYIFYMIDIFPSGSGINFTFQVNASGGSGFNEAITSTFFGMLHLFSPASTTRIKHFYARTNEYFSSSARTLDNFIAGYINTTTAITEVSFKFASGNMTGNIYMFGVS